MNLYLLDIIKNDFHFNVATYSINRHTHEETLSSFYDDENTHKSGAVYFIKKAAIHTDILEILDYDMPEKESAVVAFQKLKSVLPLLSIDCPFDEEAFDVYCCEHTLKDIEASAGQIMPILQSCFEGHPALSYLYPLFHMIMRSCYQQAGKSADAQLLQNAKLLSEEVNTLETLYTQARNYLDAVILEPSKQGLQLPSSAVAEIYHSYCLYTSKQNFQSDALSAMEIKDTFLHDIHTQTDAHSYTQDWIEYLNHTSNLITDTAIGIYPITSFKQFLCIGTQLLLEDELVIKKCKLCNGYFRVKYTSSQEYTKILPLPVMSTPTGNLTKKGYSAIRFIRNLQNHTTVYIPASAEENSLLTRHLWISLRHSMTNILKNMKTHTKKTAKQYGKNTLKKIKNCLNQILQRINV